MEREFEAYLLNEVKNRNEKITKDAELILRKNVQSEVYSYNPTEYERNRSLINSITSKIEGEVGQGVVYFNEGVLNHSSTVTKENIGILLPMFLDGGHQDNSNINNMYHNYPKRNFMQKTVDEINAKYGEESIELVDDI